MTRDEIIRMAIECGFEVHERKQRVRAEMDTLFWCDSTAKLERFAALVAAAEREECAKVCDQRKIITPEWQLDQHYNQGASHCAAAIRARGEKGQS